MNHDTYLGIEPTGRYYVLRVRRYKIHKIGTHLKTYPERPMITSRTLFVLLLSFASRISARKWRDTGTGFIALEEAWTIPELLSQVP